MFAGQPVMDALQLSGEARAQLGVGGESGPGGMHGARRCKPARRQAHRRRLADLLIVRRGRHRPRGRTLEAAPIHLVHARIVAHQDARDGRVQLHHPLRERAQIGDRHHRQARAEGQPLRHARRQPHAGEGAWAATEGNRTECAQGHVGLSQQLIGHRQDVLGVAVLE